jgi:outer membrane protein TolC
LSEQLYRNGLTDYLPVLDAQRSVYAAEDSLAKSDLNVALNLVSLYKALGGGWETLGDVAKK